MISLTGWEELSGGRGTDVGVPRLLDILDATFRANPAYELTIYDRLPKAERELFQELQRDPEFYGVLRPQKGARLGYKSVNRSVARLLLGLPTPSPLPDYVKSEPEAAVSIARMVLDGVLEIASDKGMVSGPSAFHLIFSPQPAVEPTTEIAELSLDALRYGHRLPIEPAGSLALKLYTYGRLPLSPAWTRRFPTANAVWSACGLDANGDLPPALVREWRRCDPQPPNDGWLAWEARGAHSPSVRNQTYKLYISPHPDFLGEAIAAVARTEAAAFKIGKDLPNILRPDKLVAYFDTWAPLDRAARSLEKHMGGSPAHGVPFTTQWGGNSLISWGIDPPEEEVRPRWIPRESWRLWIVNRLAAALLVARHPSEQSIEPWRFATERLRLDGINTDTWTPQGAV
jgi:hypothetical protein